MMFSTLSLILLVDWSLPSSGFSSIYTNLWCTKPSHFLLLAASENFGETNVGKTAQQQNEVYIDGLINNLTMALDRWVITGSPVKKTQVQNILYQIQREAKSETQIKTATSLAQRSGITFEDSSKELGKTDTQERRKGVDARKEWEQFRDTVEQVGQWVGRPKEESRSALSSRVVGSNGKRDLFMGSIDHRLVPESDSDGSISPETSNSLSSLNNASQRTEASRPASPKKSFFQLDEDALKDAQLRNSKMVAKLGGSFDGEILGIGGLDDILSQVKRRIWVPLAAPPSLLQELGISPVRGLLLYGKPGCGKTLIARAIGKMLSPFRPITVVSGPELMDKFVGSSEQNVRKVFDQPPPIFDHVRLNEVDDGKALSKVALHVIIMDEFDAMARTRGGKGGTGAQGDAGVARDSVVNQILAKMDGVDPLPVPTLVIGMTNKRSLIDSALLRAGRFEVQIEVPPPRSQEQRVSILKVHTKRMFEAGRLMVCDAPKESAVAKQMMAQSMDHELLCYDDLLDHIAAQCEGFSGASLAGIARAAASHALERTVNATSKSATNGTEDQSIMDCYVTKEDLELAVKDILESSGDFDWTEDKVDNASPN